ncbi:MAG: GAF domain-containing protein [Chloroflexi bacterium]|nr:GAF domain-containing protein [Chloroflexota bacterium]
MIKRDVAKQVERLTTLLEVTRALAAQIGFDDLLKLIVEKTSELLDAERSTLYLVDPETGELWSKVIQASEIREIRLRIGGPGVAAHVAATGETINLRDAYEDARFNRAVDRETGWRTRSMLVMPMRNHPGEIIGVVQVMNKRSGVFTREDEEFLASLAASAAVAVENANLYGEQRKFLYSFIEAMAATIDAKDHQTAGHAFRVTAYAVILSRAGGLPPEEVEFIRVAGLVHDYGKIAIPDAILTKPGRFTPEEYLVMRQHARYTKEILQRIRFPRSWRRIPDAASQHHERPDGHGGPWGLRGDEISRGGKILAVADVFDALTSRRYYKEAVPIEEAARVIREGSGTQFHPAVVAAFDRAMPELIVAFESFRVQALQGT